VAATADRHKLARHRNDANHASQSEKTLARMNAYSSWQIVPDNFSCSPRPVLHGGGRAWWWQTKSLTASSSRVSVLLSFSKYVSFYLELGEQNADIIVTPVIVVGVSHSTIGNRATC
jgi:hypothetical protein